MAFQHRKGTMLGRMFERLIRSTKQCMRKVIGKAKLNYDELLTVVT